MTCSGCGKPLLGRQGLCAACAQPKSEARLFAATCDQCGGPTQVPFEPDGILPVYCRSCLAS